MYNTISTRIAIYYKIKNTNVMFAKEFIKRLQGLHRVI